MLPELPHDALIHDPRPDHPRGPACPRAVARSTRLRRRPHRFVGPEVGERRRLCRRPQCWISWPTSSRSTARELEHSPDSEDTTATGGEAAVDVPDGGSRAGDEPPSGEILGEGAPGSHDAANGSDHVVDVVVVSAPGDVISAETATPAGVPSATTSPADVVPAEAAPATLETPTTEEVDRHPPTGTRSPSVRSAGRCRSGGGNHAGGGAPGRRRGLSAATTDPRSQSPSPFRPPRTPQVWCSPYPPEASRSPRRPRRRGGRNPLRSLRGGDQQWRYYLRGALTVIVLAVLAWALIWAFGELFSALGELWDTFGRSSDTTEAQSAAQWIRSQPG